MERFTILCNTCNSTEHTYVGVTTADEPYVACSYCNIDDLEEE